MKVLILATLMFLVSAKAEEPPPYVVMIWLCSEPVGLYINEDPPQFYAATDDVDAVIGQKILDAIAAERVRKLVINRGCDRRRT